MRIRLHLLTLLVVAAGVSAREVPADAAFLVALEDCSALTAVQGVCAATGTNWRVVPGGIEIRNGSDDNEELLTRRYRVSPGFAESADAFDGVRDGEARRLEAFMDTIGYWEEQLVREEAAFELAVKDRVLRCVGNRSAQVRLRWVLAAFDPESPSLLRSLTGDWPELIAIADEPTVALLRDHRLKEFVLVGGSVRDAVARLRSAVADAVAPATVAVGLRWTKREPTYSSRYLASAQVTPEQRARTKVLQAAIKAAEKENPAPPDPFGAPNDGSADPFGSPALADTELVLGVENDGTADAVIRSDWARSLSLYTGAKTPAAYLRYLANGTGCRYRLGDDVVVLRPSVIACSFGRLHEPIWVNDQFGRIVGRSEMEIRDFASARGVVYHDGDYLRYLPELGVVAFFMHLAKREALEKALGDAGVLASAPNSKKWPWPPGWQTIELGESPEEASMTEALLVLRDAFKRADGAPPFNLIWVP